MNLGFAAIVIVVLFVGAPSLESIGARAQQTPCQRACTAAASPYDPEVIRGLIQQGNDLCNCNCTGTYGGGILHVAARSGCVLCINLLTISPGSCPCDDEDDDGNTPLHIAASVCNGPTTSQAIRAGCNSDAQNDADDTPLCLAARRQNDVNCGQVVTTLVSTNAEGGSADPCITCSGGTTACESCAQTNTCSVLRDNDGNCNC